MFQLLYIVFPSYLVQQQASIIFLFTSFTPLHPHHQTTYLHHHNTTHYYTVASIHTTHHSSTQPTTLLTTPPPHPNTPPSQSPWSTLAVFNIGILDANEASRNSWSEGEVQWRGWRRVAGGGGGGGVVRWWEVELYASWVGEYDCGKGEYIELVLLTKLHISLTWSLAFFIKTHFYPLHNTFLSPPL